MKPVSIFRAINFFQSSPLVQKGTPCTAKILRVGLCRIQGFHVSYNVVIAPSSDIFEEYIELLIEPLL